MLLPINFYFLLLQFQNCSTLSTYPAGKGSSFGLGRLAAPAPAGGGVPFTENKTRLN